MCFKIQSSNNQYITKFIVCYKLFLISNFFLRVEKGALVDLETYPPFKEKIPPLLSFCP